MANATQDSLKKVRDMVSILLEKFETKRPTQFIILSKNNKVIKGEKKGYITATIHLSPAKASVPFGGVNMCAKASKGCEEACLQFSGLHNMPNAMIKRIALTIIFLKHRKAFMSRLFAETKAFMAQVRKKGMTPCIRPNALSDRYDLSCELAKAFPDLIVYDYTKLETFSKVDNIPANYHLTFSRSEENENAVAKAFSAGWNVSIVFDTDPSNLPLEYQGRKVLNGDEDDLRFIERTPEPVWIGLSLKGKNSAKEAARRTGFAIALS